MYYGVWTGKEMPDKPHVLILGESHYNDREGNDTDKELHGSTSNVIDYYLTGQRYYLFFDRIVHSFGYADTERKEFWNKVCFGNYVEELCGVKTGRAFELLKTNRTDYNDSLFNFVNENNIDVIVVFSIATYNNLPLRNRNAEEKEETFPIVSKEKGRRSWIRKFNYCKGIKHHKTNVILSKDLIVYGIPHPSAAGGYHEKVVYEILKNQRKLNGLVKAK